MDCDNIKKLVQLW